MHLSTLSEWLSFIGSVHSKEIDLGLDRIRVVAERLGVLNPESPVIIVGGTNGKGSVVAGLEAIYRTAGYKVGAFTSPYLLAHNEEVRVGGVVATDASFIEAFEKIESARSGVSLTPFEYHTLAALSIFKKEELDVMVLEVGLGGRLDAVNVMNADVAVVTSIGIDHVAWLGDTREKIAVEKAGIFRRGRPAICGDVQPPATLREAADKLGAAFLQIGDAFQFEEVGETWTWQSTPHKYSYLPRNNLLTQNMATVLMAVSCLQTKLPVTEDEIHRGLQAVHLPGRLQAYQGEVTEILDVAHNPAAAAVLAAYLRQTPCSGKTLAVFSMLDDKDIAGTIERVQPDISAWFIAPLANQRAASLEKLKKIFRLAAVTPVYENADITSAYQAARAAAIRGDRIVIFGSFSVVADIMRHKRLEP